MENLIKTIEGVGLEPKRKPGRPAKITPDLVESVARLIAKGMTEEQACIRVGINHSSFCTARMRHPEYEESEMLAHSRQACYISLTNQKAWCVAPSNAAMRHGW